MCQKPPKQRYFSITKKQSHLCNCLKFNYLSHVIRLGFEPKTHSLEGCCSIQLSYRTEPLSLLILPWKPKWVQR